QRGAVDEQPARGARRRRRRHHAGARGRGQRHRRRAQGVRCRPLGDAGHTGAGVARDRAETGLVRTLDQIPPHATRKSCRALGVLPSLLLGVGVWHRTPLSLIETLLRRTGRKTLWEENACPATFSPPARGRCWKSRSIARRSETPPPTPWRSN